MSSSNKEIEHCTLEEYINEHHSQEEMRNVFLNMDVALKYIHEHDYCIEIFHPSKIDILEELPNHVQFNNLVELPKDPDLRKKYIQEDIFHSAFIQIGFYTNIKDYLTPDFLREHFEDMVLFLPEEDVAYYRGIVQRGASVYFSEYALEKQKRDLAQLERELGDESNSVIPLEEISNDKINDKIYRQILGKDKAAFVYSLLLPMILVVGFLLFTIFSLING